MSSMRRVTGRDRRGASQISYPSLASFYTQGIKMHYDAALGVTSAASRVSQWNDQSGNGNNLVQGTGANQPLLVSSATPAGTPGIRLDSTARTMAKLAGATTTANAAWTWFAVVNVTADGIFWIHNNGAGTAGVRVNSTAGNKVLFVESASTLTDGARTANWEVWAWRIAASGGYGTAIDTKEFYVNGVLVAPSGASNLTQGTSAIDLGLAGSSALSTVAELAEAPQTLLSAADVIALSKGLMRKHGVT